MFNNTFIKHLVLARSHGERSLKIGQQMTKLWAGIKLTPFDLHSPTTGFDVFLRHPVLYSVKESTDVVMNVGDRSTLYR